LDKVRLGKTNMMVSKLGFGGIPIQRVSEDEAVAVVRRCLELGITFIDTANGYTTSEERIGKAISGQRKRPLLATKSLSRSRDGISRHLQQSLKQLGMESIDLYQFHSVNNFNTLDMILSPDGPMAVLEEAKRTGQVKHIGMTSHQIDVAKEAVKSDRFETIMFPFNFVSCEAADELLPLAREHDVGFIGMKPLAGGMLENVTIAFKYLFQFPDVVPIPGIEKVHEIEEIVAVLQGPGEMTAADQREMERLRQELGTRFCRRCDYCQPCTAEIAISTVMAFPGFVRRLPAQTLFAGWIPAIMEKTTECTQCGDCEERCPYHLPIMEMIEEHFSQYEAEKRKYQGQPSSI